MCALVVGVSVCLQLWYHGKGSVNILLKIKVGNRNGCSLP